MLPRVARGDLVFYSAASTAVVLASGAAAVYPAVAGLVLGGTALLIVTMWKASLAAPLLLVAAVPLARPGILGEQLSPLATGLVCFAAFLALVLDRGRPAILHRKARPLRSVCLWLFAVYLWLLVLVAAGRGVVEPQSLVQSLVLTVATVWAAAVVLADRARAVQVGKLFSLLVVLCCASYLVTLGLWRVGGVGTGLVSFMPVGDLDPQPVYFPFTTTAGVQGSVPIFDTLPRFVGIAREPGWMAMLVAFTYFLLPRIGWSRWWVKLVLLVALLGTVSTAGFGVFVIVWAYEVFIRPRPYRDLFLAFLRQTFGVAVLAGAAYLAVYAPVFGLAQKATLNEVSLQDRTLATEAGLEALQESPLFGVEVTNLAAINLVAAVAAFGLPFAVLVLASLLLPRRTHRPMAMSTAPVAVLVLTLLTSQPALDSTLVWMLALLAYSITQPRGEDRSAHAQRPRATGVLRGKDLAGRQVHAGHLAE